MSNSTLFSPFKLGPFILRNRVVFAPLTRGRATQNHVPTDIMATHYGLRADAGLIISEAVGISRQGCGWYRAPGIWNYQQISEWKKITNKVHDNNGIIAIQLWHMGRQAHSDVTGQPIVSASPIGLKGVVTTIKGVKKPYEIPKELTINEIKQIVEDYANAAQNAINAGFDIIALHGANGYLIDTFLQSCSNKRNDEYGGTVQKRLLFMKQIVNRILSKGIPSNRIGIRLTPNGGYARMGSVDNTETFTAAIDWLAMKKLGFIEILDGKDTLFLVMSKFMVKNPFTLKMVRDITNKYGGNTAVMGNVNYTKKTAEKVINNGDADLISFGRAFMSNPDLVYRLQNDIKLAPMAQYKHWFGWNMKEEGYIDYPVVRPKMSKL